MRFQQLKQFNPKEDNMNNATLETMTAERDSLRAAFIRYIALDQFIGCGVQPRTTSTPTLKTCGTPCAAER